MERGVSKEGLWSGLDEVNLARQPFGSGCLFRMSMAALALTFSPEEYNDTAKTVNCREEINSFHFTMKIRIS